MLFSLDFDDAGGKVEKGMRVWCGWVFLVGVVWAYDTSWWALLPCGSNLPIQPKLVINSHIRYHRALTYLMHSLASVGFQDYCRLIIVVGGHKEDEISKIGNITIVKRVINAHDYTGFDTLYLYRSHPDIEAPYYFYVHDTCLFHPSFVSFFSALPNRMGSNPQTILYPEEKGSSNILAIGKGVVEAIGTTYRFNMTKRQAWLLEVEGEGIRKFGEVKTTQNRMGLGDYDIYHTGLKRKLFLYPEFGVFKTIFWDHTGDMEGNPQHF